MRTAMDLVEIERDDEQDEKVRPGLRAAVEEGTQRRQHCEREWQVLP